MRSQFKIDSVKEYIQTQKPALEKERYYLAGALELKKSSIKKRKLDDLEIE